LDLSSGRSHGFEGGIKPLTAPHADVSMTPNPPPRVDSNKLESGRPPRSRWLRWLVPATAALAVAGLAISCGTFERTVVAPPAIPGATFTGSAACVDCHEAIVKEFRTADHARVQAHGSNAIEAGCESCHGPASLHNDSGGAPGTIINPERNPQVCFDCHLNVRAEFSHASHHPVGTNRLTCTDCHDPHTGSAHRAGRTQLLSENAGCLQCHPAQAGPHVFEHEVIREGCTICHQPHGSVNAKLLVARNATLCLRCHFQQQVAGETRIGGVDHSQFLSRGTCWSAGCHEAVHGSQVNSSLRY
jgi:predicted CXXCH cytochrome family protein